MSLDAALDVEAALTLWALNTDVLIPEFFITVLIQRAIVSLQTGPYGLTKLTNNLLEVLTLKVLRKYSCNTVTTHKFLSGSYFVSFIKVDISLVLIVLQAYVSQKQHLDHL